MKNFELSQKLERFFIESKNHLGQDFYDRFNISQNIKCADLPVTQLLKVLSSLNVTLDSVLIGQIDFNALAAQANGENRMSQRYKSGIERSSRYAAIYMLEFVSLKYGEATRDFLMQHLQLTEQHLKGPKEWNNLLLSYDICNYIGKYFGKEFVEEMGMNGFQKGDNFKEDPRELSVVNVFDKFFDDIIPLNVEKNYTWKIHKMINDSVYIAGYPSEDVVREYGRAVVGSESLASLRGGFLRAIPEKILKRRAIVEHILSYAEGADFDLYRITFSQPIAHTQNKLQ